MPLDSIWWNENLDRINTSDKSLGESFDSNKYSKELAAVGQEINETRELQLKNADELKKLLKDGYENNKIENLISVEKNRLDRLHQAILKLDISNKNNEWYKTLEEILNEDNKNTEEKLELMVKIIHNMNDEIDVEHEDNTTEHTEFKCWNRALFFNYIFNNYGGKLGIEKSNICLPYGHCMNIIKIWWQTYLVDWWAGCFNKIDNYTIEEKWSRKCVVLNKPIENFKGSWTFYPFSSFPYTENLKKDDLELYTSFNLQGYSYYFTNKLYEAAQKYYNDGSIKDKNWLKKFFDEHLKEQENPLKEILDEGDSLAIDSRENQISILKKQIEKSLSYEENKEKFDNMNEYMKTITENSHDLRPEEREWKEWEDWPLKQFHKADKKSMDALKIPKEMIPKILEALTKKVGNTENTKNFRARTIKRIRRRKANQPNIKNISDYVVKQFEKYKFNKDEKILDDPELDSVVKNFVNAIDKKAGQLNKELKDYLPTYLSSLTK